MASNYTEHYQLPIWSPEDSFLREEFNETNQKIEDALGGLVLEPLKAASRSYTGDGATNRTIALDKTPLAVFVCD